MPARSRVDLPLLEREGEVEVIASVLGEAQSGRGGVLVLEAAAGMGKSLLLRRAVEIGREAGIGVLRARGDVLARDHPYGVERELLAPALRALGEGERADILAGAAAPAGELLLGGNGVAGVAAGSDVDHALHWVVAGLAERQPLLLAVDDAHWADRPSMRALTVLARRLEDLPVALVLTTRPNEPDAPQDLIDRIAAEPIAERLTPRSLTSTASAELVRALMPEATERFCAACHDACGGNPFLLRQTVAEVRTMGLAPDDEAAAQVLAISGRGIARTILVRLDSLPPEAGAVARALAVLGDGSPLTRVAALAELSPAAAGVGADALAAVELLRPSTPLAFTNPVVRQAVHDALPTHRRSSMHRLAARLLSRERSAAIEDVAAHLLASTPAGDPWTVEQLVLAAGAATRNGAPDVAVSYLERASREPPPELQRLDVLLELGLRAFDAHDARALDALETAYAAAADPLQRAAVLAPLVRTQIVTGKGTQIIDEVDALAEELRLEAPLASLELELAAIDACSNTTDLVRVRELPRRVAAFAERAAPHAEMRHLALAMQAWQEGVVGESADRTASLAADALAEGSALLAPEQARGWLAAIRPLVVADRFEVATQLVRSQLDRLNAAGMRTMWGATVLYHSHLEYRTGDLAAAETDARAGLACFDPGDHLRQMAVAALVEALVAQGGVAEAGRILDEAGMLDPARAVDWPPMRLARGRYHAAAGNLDAAIDDLLASGERQVLQGTRNPAWNPWRSEAALALLVRGRAAEAVALAEEELALARVWGAPRALGRALRVHGVVAGSLTELAEAVAVLEGSGARLELAMALLEHGAALRRAGKRNEARERLHRAVDLATRCGATPVVERAHDEMKSLGARLHRTAVTGVDALTPSERRVCELALTGLTYRQIAQSLFLSVKTVEAHLHRSYGKLGIETRAELAGAFAAG